MKFRKKPIVIEAFKYDGDLMDKNGEYYVPQWMQSACRVGLAYFVEDGQLHLKTLEGSLHVSVGDYIIKGVQDELYPCKPDIFLATYEVAE